MALKKRGRKLLVASMGVAAVSYVACSGDTSGNLMPPTAADGGTDAMDAPTDTKPPINWDVVANLLPPQGD